MHSHHLAYATWDRLSNQTPRPMEATGINQRIAFIRRRPFKNKYDDDVPNELMAVYAIVYKGHDTNEYVYFIRPDGN